MTGDTPGIAELAERFAAGADTPVAHLAATLGRIDRLDGRLASFVALDGARAMAAAGEATARWAAGQPLGPIDGVPIGIKDVIDVAGLPTTCHSRLRLDAVAAEDAAVVARLRAGGAIILGKLATHEFAIGGPAFDLPFPPARNPWNPDHHPGGSSSGAGAAVAAGLVAGAIGTDTAGSVRHPASACGIVGLKPTYDLVPRAGVFPLAWSLDHVGPLARDARDTALLLGAMTGGSYAANLAGGIGGLRIGVVRRFHGEDMRADADTAAAFETVVELLAREGAAVAEVTLPPLTDFAVVNRVILQAEGFAVHAADLRARPEAFSAATRRALLPGAFLSAKDYLAASRHRSRLAWTIDAAFAACDVLLTASSMEPACRIDDPAEIARTYMLQARTPFNLSGHPALAMMSGLSSTGLPLSVQFAAPAFAEARLLRVAHAVERASGGARRPSMA